LLALLALIVLLAGCSPSGPEGLPEPQQSASAAPGPPEVRYPRANGPGSLDHVVVIVEENKTADRILGSSEAPFINRLAADYALATDYSAVARPSLPNYLALTSGTTAGITSDCLPSPDCRAAVPSIAGEIDRSGRTWKMYAEGMPVPCSREDSGRYAVKHNPFVYYPEVADDAGYCAEHVVPLAELDGDLASAPGFPDFAFISPDLCHDMHDCPVGAGDDWLSEWVPRILAAPAFTRGPSLLVVVWDEGHGSSNKVAAIFAGPAARKGYRSATAFNHYSLLHTIQRAWGLAPLTGNVRKAPLMDGMLR
jgi:phosphatidylinositol-3-phosphatase